MKFDQKSSFNFKTSIFKTVKKPCIALFIPKYANICHLLLLKERHVPLACLNKTVLHKLADFKISVRQILSLIQTTFNLLIKIQDRTVQTVHVNMFFQYSLNILEKQMGLG